MESHDQYAQRTGDSAEPRHSTEASQVPHEHTSRSERLPVRLERDLRSGSRDIRELRQLGAKDVNEKKEKHEQNMMIVLELSVSKREEGNGMP